jgi:hypothetical protein
MKLKLNNMTNENTGYLPQIAFNLVDESRTTLEYFINKHIEEFGKFSSSDLMWIFDASASIKRTRAQETNEWNDSLNIESYTL